MVSYLSVPSYSLVKSRGLSYDELALVEPLAIGAHGVCRANIKKDEFVLAFANQVIAQIELFGQTAKYPVGVYTLPKHLDEKVARLQLKKLNAQLTELSTEQADYIGVKKVGPYKPETYRY